MLFTSSFKLLSVAAFLLPALLVGASPHSLSERQGTGEIRHLKLIGYVGSDPTNRMREFDEVTLSAITGKEDTFIVRGGWQGTPAQAKATKLAGVYTDWINQGPRENLLAFGHDGGVLRGGKLMYYVIFEDDEKHEDSDGSDDTVKGR